MPRVKRGTMTHKRHKKVLKQAQGFWGARSRLFKTAKEAVMRSLRYAYRDRRVRKREFRQLWITRINAACRANGIQYSRFMEGLTKAGVVLDRKALAEVAINDEKGFTELVDRARAQISAT